MCIYEGHMCKCIPNMKFLCLTLCQEEVCTDDDTNDTGCQHNDDGQCMIVQGSLVDKPNEPKSTRETQDQEKKRAIRLSIF